MRQINSPMPVNAARQNLPGKIGRNISNQFAYNSESASKNPVKQSGIDDPSRQNGVSSSQKGASPRLASNSGVPKNFKDALQMAEEDLDETGKSVRESNDAGIMGLSGVLVANLIGAMTDSAADGQDVTVDAVVDMVADTAVDETVGMTEIIDGTTEPMAEALGAVLADTATDEPFNGMAGHGYADALIDNLAGELASRLADTTTGAADGYIAVNNPVDRKSNDGNGLTIKDVDILEDTSEKGTETPVVVVDEPSAEPKTARMPEHEIKPDNDVAPITGEAPRADLPEAMKNDKPENARPSDMAGQTTVKNEAPAENTQDVLAPSNANNTVNDSGGANAARSETVRSEIRQSPVNEPVAEKKEAQSERSYLLQNVNNGEETEKTAISAATAESDVNNNETGSESDPLADEIEIKPRDNNQQQVQFVQGYTRERETIPVDSQPQVITHDVREADFSRMVERMTTAYQGGKNTFEIHLKPEFLGRMAITLSMEENGLTARIRTSSAETRGMISEQLVSLETSLRERGIEVVHVDVVYSELPRDFGGDSARQEWRGEQKKSVRVNKTEAAQQGIYDVYAETGQIGEHNSIDVIA